MTINKEWVSHTKSVQVNDNIYVCDFIDSAGQEEYA